MELSEFPRDLQKRRRAEGDSPSPAGKRLPTTHSTTSDPAICNRCRGIRWMDLAATPPATKSGRNAADLPFVDRDALSQASCPICQLLAQVVPKGLNGQCCRLVALSSSLAIAGRNVPAGERTEHSDCTVLFPVLEAKFADKTAKSRIAQDWYEAGCLALVRDEDKKHLLDTGPRQISKAVNFELIEGWLKHCTTQHHDACKNTGGGSSDIRGLRVIDCYSRRTIEAPADCKYFALSYVWGSPATAQSQRENGDSIKAEAKFPPVVIDAIHVTLSLGERYLWVDQLCIDQNDGPTKAAQIAQMYEIYSYAHLTLVAAAGEDASYGLPGVRKKYRHPQGRFSVDNVTITRVFPHTSAELSASTWAKRGWTYQEGYLSPRRLIFTDYQVSYLCNVMYCAEAVRKLQPLSRLEQNAEISSFLEMIPSSSTYNKTSTNNKWEHLKQKQLVNYTKRRLTKDSDSLNAVLGLFRALEPTDIRHLHGIPIRRISQPAAASGFEFSIAWYHEALGIRRQKFPSWSWSGWEGGIRMNEPDIRVSDECEIELVGEDGHVISLQKWFCQEMKIPSLSSPNAPRVLRITAMAVQISLEEKSWDDLDESRSQMSQLAGMSFMNGIHAVLPIREDVTAMTYAYLDEEVPLDCKVLGLILRPKCPIPYTKRRHTILLLKSDGEYHQRIGLVRVPSWHKTRAAAVGDFDPQIVYVNSEGMPLEELTSGGTPPLWLQGAVKRTVTIS